MRACVCVCVCVVIMELIIQRNEKAEPKIVYRLFVFICSSFLKDFLKMFDLKKNVEIKL